MPVIVKKGPKAKAEKQHAKEAQTIQSNDRLDAFVSSMNKEMKGVGRIDRGREIQNMDPPRKRTGILGLDVMSSGGLPAGCAVKFWGPYSSGKTSSAVRCLTTAQRRGEPVAFAAIENFDKEWHRLGGLWIPYSKEEYEKARLKKEPDLIKQMEAYDRWGEDSGCGQFLLLQHMHGDGILEMAARLVKANLVSIIAEDSLSVTKNSRQLEEMEIGDEERGGGGQIQMFNRFAARCFSAFNTRYDDENKPDMNGRHMNQTTVLCIDQARIKIVTTGRTHQVQYQEPNGEALKHFWAFNVMFRRGEEIGAEIAGLDGDKRWEHWAVEITAKVTKSKIGTPGRFANWDLYVDNHDDFEKGAIDRSKEIRMWAVKYNVIEQTGASYAYNGERLAIGKDKLDAFLRERPDLCQEIEDEVVRRCRM